MEKVRRQAMLSWFGLGLLAILFGALAIFQYRWIAEVSLAERARLRDNLQSGLNRVSRDFNTDFARTLSGLQPTPEELSSLGRDQAYAERLAKWKASARHPDLFRTVALVVPVERELIFRVFGPQQGSFSDTAWPGELLPLRDWLKSRLESAYPPGPGPGGPGGSQRATSTVVEIPRFEISPAGRREAEWLVLDINPEYVAKVVLPELVMRHFGTAAANEYQLELMNRFGLGFRAGLEGMEPRFAGGESRREADATATIFEVRFEPAGGGPRRVRGFGGPPPPPGEFAPPGGPPAEAGRGRWLLSAWHQAGSLDALVQRARWRNLAVAFGILLLMIGTMVALLRFSQQAQKLADMQMQFVAGVSHELRTPLTVIRTAAYNLRGRIAGNPAQVERYGKLIQDESERLSAIVEQVMLFASAKAGQVIRERKPFAAETAIEESLRSSRSALESNACTVDKDVEPNLPLLLGDSMALRHAVQNLIQNAVKYGMENEKWIGVRARKVESDKGDAVEICVEDHGPGIQPSEAAHLFDPFFRGERAVRDQIHGTGLGLNLVKQIVEAHGGKVTVDSEPGRGTRFVLSIPAAPEQYQDEFANTVG